MTPVKLMKNGRTWSVPDISEDSNSDEYVVVKQLPVNSAVPTTIDVAEFLTSGVNNVMIKVTGTVTEVTTPAFVYTVQLTSLSVDAGNFKWWTAYPAT